MLVDASQIEEKSRAKNNRDLIMLSFDLVAMLEHSVLQSDPSNVRRSWKT
ncbi:hypothetical protein [Atopomonas hussainii]|nr:hypothetical protein [Atopomonas hussainii]